MNLKFATAFALLVSGSPVLAESHASGDAAEGEKAFRQCRACHAIVDDEGNDIMKGGRSGPNLYGIPGQAAGSVEGFKYKDSIVEAGENGLVWDEESFVAYVQDPTGFLKEVTGDSGARSGMAFKLRKEEDAVNLWAYIVSVSPEPGS